MNTRIALIVVALLAGFASGPSSLESAAQSQPPLAWGDLLFDFVGCALALPFVLSFQALIGNDRALRIGWSFFALIALFFVGAGVSGIAVAASRADIHPHSFLFLVMGVSSVAGLVLVKLAFRQRFQNAA